MNNDNILKNTVRRCKERNILIPTITQQKNPELIPEGIKKELKDIGLWDLNSRNLFRITWKNEPVSKGGGFGSPNYIEIPKELTGLRSRILVLLGKYFPTGAHKVGAAFGCLVPRLVTGEFDPTTQKAVWPSTGNYCRGGAYDSYLLGITPIAILPEEMSQERFDWLKSLGSEVFATPGCESNVKEIYDKCHNLKAQRGNKVVIFNQFNEIGNTAWHYHVTGSAMKEVFEKESHDGQRLAALCLTQGSAGTLGAGEYLKEIYPSMKMAVSEALQCPTLLLNGFGGHRIEGIGDKHVPWIHNLKNTDVVIDIDDNHPIAIMRLFNEPAGKEYLKHLGIEDEFISKLNLLGISGIANMITAIKTAKYYEMNENDILITVATDSMEMYGSRLNEYRDKDGEYTKEQALRDHLRIIAEASIDFMEEVGYYGKKRMHNLKYFTWIEQQKLLVKDLNAQWYDDNWWTSRYKDFANLDEKINEFNEATGLASKYR